MKTYKCNACGDSKPRSGFRTNSRDKTRAVRCRACYQTVSSHRYFTDEVYRIRKLEAARYRTLSVKFSLSRMQVDALFRSAGNKCQVCGGPETVLFKGKVKRLSVDHDHSTGRVRGLLCCACNVFMGRVDAHPGTLARLTEYIASSRDWRQP